MDNGVYFPTLEHLFFLIPSGIMVPKDTHVRPQKDQLINNTSEYHENLLSSAGPTYSKQRGDSCQLTHNRIVTIKARP